MNSTLSNTVEPRILKTIFVFVVLSLLSGVIVAAVEVVHHGITDRWLTPTQISEYAAVIALYDSLIWSVICFPLFALLLIAVRRGDVGSLNVQATLFCIAQSIFILFALFVNEGKVKGWNFYGHLASIIVIASWLLIRRVKGTGPMTSSTSEMNEIHG